jgi:hypothetical protein
METMAKSEARLQKNLYLRALEIGFEVGESGISFDEIKEKLAKEGYTMPGIVFRKWFYTNFEWPNVIEYRTKVINYPEATYDDKSYRLFYNAVMLYIEYQELNQAMKSAKLASRHARIAIWIAVVSMVLNVLFQFYDSCS